MPTRCIAAGCGKTTKDGVSLHLFPADPKYRQLWAANVRLKRTTEWSGPTSFSALCSEHFEPSCFESGMHHTFDMKRKVALKHDAIPTIFPASKSKKVPERRVEPRGAFAKREKKRVLLEAFQAYDAKYCGGSGSGAVPSSIQKLKESTPASDSGAVPVSIQKLGELTTGGGKVQDKNLPTNIADYSQMTWDDGKERDENQPAEIADYFQTTWDDGKEQDDNLPTKIADYSQMTLNDGIEGDDDALSEMADYSVMTFEDGKVQHRILPTEIADYSQMTLNDGIERDDDALSEMADYSVMTFEDGKVQHRILPTEIADYSQMTLNDGIERDDDALSEMADYSVMTFEDGKVQHRILPTEIADTSLMPIDDSKVRNESVLTEIRDSSAMTTEDCSEVLEQITNGGEDGGHVYEGLQSFIPNEFSRWKKLRDQMLPHSDLLKYTRRVVEDEFTSWTDDEAFASYLLDCLELDLAHGSEINQEGDEDKEVHTELHRIFPDEAERWELLRDRMKNLPYFDRYVNNPDRPKWRTDELFTSCLLDRLEEQLENLQPAEKRDEESEQHHQEEDTTEEEEEEEEAEEDEELYDDPNDADYVPEYIEPRPRRKPGRFSSPILPKEPNESSSDSDQIEDADVMAKPKQKVHQCNICKEHLPTQFQVIHHYLTHHEEVYNNKTPSKKKTTSLPPTMKAEDFSTVLCYCRQCGSYEADLKRHRRENHQVCKVCGVVCASQTFLLKHMERHTKTEEERKNLLCDYCGKRYVTRNAFSRHLKVHRGEKLKKYKCNICNIIVAGALRRHKLIHNNEQPFECNVCGRRFTQRNNMFKHTRIHTGIKPYSCDLCDESFNHNISLKNHKKKKHGIDWWNKTVLSVVKLPDSSQQSNCKPEPEPKPGSKAKAKPKPKLKPAEPKSKPKPKSKLKSKPKAKPKAKPKPKSESKPKPESKHQTRSKSKSLKRK
ncbi:uncharacterized protein LOC117291511 isoform X2 [Asterias rubens]|uniref:uncharacterized protein LOC117291511 isoform X2 n=1 Tax=Asterias rubens TaxID=7604 RepID=UPI001455981A|nr:uncharacterized protein LOC117291511 isoform X2 [Asterias rubens]